MPRRPSLPTLATAVVLVLGGLPLAAQAAPPAKVSKSIDRVYGAGARVDKTTADPVEIGKDIRNISGATISSNAVTRSVRLALRQLADWRTAGKLK